MFSLHEKTFKRAITLILAGSTLFGSLMIYLNVSVSARLAALGRDGRLLAIQYTTHLGRSLWDAASQRNLMESSQELSTLIIQMQAYEGMTRGQDAFLYRLTRERLAQLKEIVAGQFIPSAAPFLDARTRAFDFPKYYLEHILIPATELLERQELKKEEAAFWDSKSARIMAGLAVLAVAAFLLTLSLVLSGKIRYGLAGIGLAILMSVALIILGSLVPSWSGPSDGSIRLYARASGALLRSGLMLDVVGDLDQAVAFADQASNDIAAIVRRDAAYVSALRLQAQARILRGEALVFRGRAQEGKAEIGLGASDLDRVIRAGKGDGYIYWGRGSAALLLDEPAQARGWLAKARALLPDQSFALGVLQSLAWLNDGRKAEAWDALEKAIDYALGHPLASDPNFFRAYIRNLERREEVLAVPGLADMKKRLKEAAVAISACGQARPNPVSSDFSAPAFVAPAYDAAGNVASLPPQASFPKYTGRVYYELPFRGMKPGLRIVHKVYRRLPGQVFWQEQLRLGRLERWAGEAEGRVLRSIEYPLPEAGEGLAPGDYRVEFFIEGNLITVGTFKIQ